MEVKPHILNQVVLHSIHDLGESSADTQLRALFVNQIDENLLIIGGFNLSDMLVSEGEWLICVLMDSHSGTPLHSGFLTPESGNGATCLHIGSDSHGFSLLIESDHMLSLHEISNIPFFVDPSHYESSPRSPAILLGNQSKVEFLGRISHQWLDIEVAKDARYLERCVGKVIEIFKKIVVEDEMGHIAYTVRVLVRQVS
jgi:hypothetical protein